MAPSCAADAAVAGSRDFLAGGCYAGRMARIFEGPGKPDFAIDLGTANTRIITQEGLVFDEPTLCCFAGSSDGGELVAAGTEARSMLDRTSGTLRIRRPLSRGVLSDMHAARDYIAYAVRTAVGQRRLRSFRAAIGVPADATNAERSALLTAATDAGLGRVELLSEPLMAALGANLPVDLPQGTLIVECGAGTTEAAVITLGGICAAMSVRGGGDALDTAIVDHLHFRHKFLIGACTAERLKRDLLAMLLEPTSQSTDFRIKGRSLITGLPEARHFTFSDLCPAVDKHVGSITGMIADLLSKVPPELSGDIHEGGILLTGGSAAIGLLGPALAATTGLPVRMAEEQAHCVALGLHKAMMH